MSDRSAEAIAHALGADRHAGYWVAKCPAHDDGSPSLSICDATDGTALVKCHAGCSQEAVIDALRSLGLWPDSSGRRDRPAATETHKADDARRSARAKQIWHESVDPRGTWAEDYLASRGLSLPSDAEILLRTLRFHERCPFPDHVTAPALICAFTPIRTEIPGDPFFDPPLVAIHRIRGRGHGNKAMLGHVMGCAVMISPWWYVREHLHVCEGVETALALCGQGANDPEDCHCPIWALGSAGAIGGFPVIRRVRRLVVWADNDVSGTGEAARACARRWTAVGKVVVIRYPSKEGGDYAD